MGSYRYWLTAAELNGRLARLCNEDLVEANPYPEFSPERRQFSMGWVYVDKHPEFLRTNFIKSLAVTTGGML
jgi:hypothetical protein